MPGGDVGEEEEEDSDDDMPPLEGDEEEAGKDTKDTKVAA